MSTAKKPNPGSHAAVEQGCKCPVIDNHHGDGVPYGDMIHRTFWISEVCPMHGTDASKTEAQS